MTDKLFDNFVRDKLEQYPSPVPEGLWEKIVNEKSRKPKGFWWISTQGWLTGIGVAAMITGGLYFTVNNKKLTLSNQNSTPAISIQTKKTNPNKKEITINAPGNGTLTANEAGINKNMNQNGNFTHSTDEESHTYTSAVSGNFINNSSKKMPDAISFNPYPNNRAFSSGFTNNSTEENRWGDNMLMPGTSFTAQVQSFNNSLYSLDNLHLPPLNLRKILGIDDCPSANGSHRNDWYLEIYGSPDYVMKSVTANGASASYLQKKDSIETLRGGFTIGARLSKTIGEHTFLKTGLQYSQINERFSLRTENERKTTTVIVTRLITRPQGDTTISDTTSLTQIGYRIRTNINHYKNIEIPILLGYEFGHPGDNWNAAVSGGIILNASSWYSGETLDTAYNVISINAKGNNGVYQHSMTMSVYGSVSVSRKINDKMDVFAEPYFRYNLSNMSSTLGILQRFSAAGLSVGARIKLNNRKQHL